MIKNWAGITNPGNHFIFNFVIQNFKNGKHSLKKARTVPL